MRGLLAASRFIPIRALAPRAAVFLAAVFLAGGSLAPAPASGQSDELADRLRQRITAEELYRQTEAIVRHERPSGSPGESAAIDHIVETLRGDGIDVQVHSFQAWTSDPLSASVTALETGFAPEAITAAYSASVDGLEAPLVDVGSSAEMGDWIDRTTGEALRVDVPEGVPEVEGAVALVRGLPEPESAWVLQAMGAVGAIFVNAEERLNELIITTVWGTPSVRNVHRNPTLPVAQVRAAAGETLARLAAEGGHVRLSVAVDTGWKTLRLVVARILPTPDATYALLGGHIDSWHHGATDEGASNAAMVELARAFHAERGSLRRGLVVAWWPGHSNGRYAGSAWFADHFHAELGQRALAYLNVDGIGQIDAARFSAAVSASLEPLALEVVERLAGTDARAFRPGRNSDQAFNGIGLPQLQFNHSRLPEDGGTWWWHTPDDTLDKVDPEVLELDTELYATALARLLADPSLPIDLSGAVEALRNRLQEADARAGADFDLSGTLALAERLVAEIHARQEGTRPVADVTALAVVRPLHRVLYTAAGAYHPDPAVEVGLLPGLAAVESLGSAAAASRGFALTALVRERNRIDDAIREALRAIAARTSP